MTIYFCLIKYYQGNIIEEMSEKGKLLKEVIEKHIKEDGCFAS
jgi:hypothetical protein